MSDKKEKDALEALVGAEEKSPLDDEQNIVASRARNKTVMLSPEMTGEVRAMLQQQSLPSREAPQPESSQFTTPQPAGMDSLFSGPDRFETRSTSVVDTDSISGFEEVAGNVSDKEGGFDPLTSLVTGTNPLSAFGSEEKSTDAESFQAEPTPAPAVEQPAAAGFSVSHAEEVVVEPKVSSSAPRRPGPKGWHGVVSSREEKGRLVGLLVSYDALEEGEVFEIRTGRFLITSRATDNGDYLLVEDESISPLHAIVRVTDDGKIQVLDQLSEFGTGLCKAGKTEEEEVAGGLATVKHGDTVRFGKRYFVVVSIPKIVKKEA